MILRKRFIFQFNPKNVYPFCQNPQKFVLNKNHLGINISKSIMVLVKQR